MYIVQISDTHLVEPGDLTLGVAPMADKLRRVVAHINGLEPQPDVVLVTGDITHDGRLAQAQLAAGILAGLRAPFYVIGGNHDTRETLWQVFGGGAIPSRNGDLIGYRINAPINLIGLDSTVAGASGGRIGPEQLAWLKRMLDDRPTLVFMHHPPVKVSILETDHDGFEGSAALEALIREHPNVLRILCGHIHLTTHAAWAGTIVSTAPSIGMALRRDLSMTKPSAFYLSPPAYLLHHMTDHGTLISHHVNVDEGDGPHLF